MKQRIYYLLWIALPVPVFAQPTITNAENFSIGNVLRFQDCNPDSVSAGSSGPNQSWNFSMLAPQPGTVTVDMVSPASTTNGSLFPGSTITEKHSSGQFVYFSQAPDGNDMHGFVDTTPGSSITITYPNPARMSKHPITFGTMLTDTFTDHFTASGYNFSGQGVVTISGDAYGTLVLPGRTFSNTLRVKIVQEEDDTLLQFGTVSHFSRVIYKWFNTDNRSALLIIDSINTGVSVIKDVKYLLDPVTTGIPALNLKSGFHCYPNPAGNELNLLCEENGELKILNHVGETLKVCEISGRKTLVEMDQFAEGIYFLIFQTTGSRLIRKLVIQH